MTQEKPSKDTRVTSENKDAKQARARKRSKPPIIRMLALLALCGLIANDAFGGGMALFTTAKTLPEATISVIDPEGGSSSGGGGGDVRLSEGDVILYQFSFSPVPNASNRGMNSYLTEYVPPGTEVVGVRFIDSDGRTVIPEQPGLALDGCSGGAQCTNFDELPCSSGAACGAVKANNVDLFGGSVSQVHAETGVFFTNDPRLARTPDDVFITPINGIPMKEPVAVDQELAPLLGYAGPTYYAHNHWDYDQVLAFGIANSRGNFSGNSGKGHGPYGYGSPVAGPQTFYMYEASEVGATDATDTIQFNDTIGPWSRIEVPGSMVGFGGCVEAGCSPQATGLFTRSILPAATTSTCGASGTDPCIGADITPANATDAVAVRFAGGVARTGVVAGAEIALRVKTGGIPIDPGFGTSGANVNCMETVGSNIATRDTGNDGDNIQWGSYIGSPSCAFLRTLLTMDADVDIALGSGGFEDVNYTLKIKNLSINPETNVIVRQRWDSTTSKTPSVTSGPTPTGPANCPAPDDGLQCYTWDLGTLQPSDEIIIKTHFTASGSGGGTMVMEATYNSTELTALSGVDFTTRDVTVIKAIALPEVDLAPNWTVTDTFIAADGSQDAVLSGTIANNGTKDFTYDELNFTLPSGWSLKNDQITIDSFAAFDCLPSGSSTPTCSIGESFAPSESHAITVTLDVPATSPDALFDIDLTFWGSQPSFGGGFETFLPKISTINVGAVRTNPPVLTCPIKSSAPSIPGTADPGADVVVSFNLMPRADVTADGSGDFATTSYDDYGPFGQPYGGIEVTATALLAGELISEKSAYCDTTPSRACSDGFDNDGDGKFDFPDDPGCDSLTDNDESDDPECGDGVDNDGDSDGTDYPNDPDCYGPNDPSEAPECRDGIDNDGDGKIDSGAGNDPECTDADDKTEGFVAACQDKLNNDGGEDGLIDFPDDPGCHSPFDDSEEDTAYNPSDIKPRLLIVFDTSGSMNWNTCERSFTGGDGSLDCPGTDVVCADLPGTCGGGSTLTCDNTLKDDSRMFKVKQGLTDVVGSFGEAEFGLMKFTQRGMDWGCPGSNASAQSGGWQGGGSAPCPSFGGGDLVVGFSLDNTPTILGYLDGETNYPVGDPPPTLDHELRGTGTTPIAGALTDARTAIEAAKLDDNIVDCRPYRVILVTDGEETCGGNPVAAATALAGDESYVTVIGFAIDDSAVVAQLDGIANAGSESGSDPAILVDDSSQLASAIATVITNSIRYEVCNNKDDDCDFETDEDFKPPLGDDCNNGELGLCYRPGTFVCTADELGTECNAPDGSASNIPEVCNNLDDDCNGLIDDGITCNCLGFELCNGVDDDCDGIIDNNISGVGADCGINFGACEFGTIQCVDADNNVATENSALDCVGGTGPAVGDVCDGIDNDCDCIADTDLDLMLCDSGDFNVDEDPGPECYPGATAGCVDDGAGGFTCQGLCTPGRVECVAGAPGGCVGFTGPGVEVCNGIDESCSGIADDPWITLGMGGVCNNTGANGNGTTDGIGACYAEGVLICPDDTSDTSSLKCTAPQNITPGVEICDGIDNDCDGKIDETDDPPPGGLDPAIIGQPCGGAGGCSVGSLQCVDVDMDPLTPNSEIKCVGSTGGVDEICNGADDNCNGEIDEFIAGVDADCYPDGMVGCTYNDVTEVFDCEGSCAIGATVCIPPEIVCDGFRGPQPEDICDGIDNDCDGQIDEDPCPVAGDVCFSGECVSPCTTSEFPCPFGEQCQVLDDSACDVPPCRFCVDDPCSGVTCDNNEQCDSDTGLCVDLCADVSCATGESCSFGFCLDCIAAPCASGEVCRIGTGCIPDPCLGVTCGAEEFCEEGSCISLTCDPECGAGQQCVEGACVDDMCDGVTCGANQACNPTTGECVGDLCFGRICPDGQACNPSSGDCIDDPCRFTTCPSDFSCEVDFDGTSTCTANNVEDDSEYVTVGGGGCLSASNGGSGGGLLVLLGAALFAVTRRRRRG